MNILYIEHTPIDVRYYLTKEHTLERYIIEKNDFSYTCGSIWRGTFIGESPNKEYGFLDVGLHTPLFVKRTQKLKIGDNLLVQIIKESSNHKFPVASTHIVFKTADISLDIPEFEKANRKNPFQSIKNTPHGIKIHPLSSLSDLEQDKYVKEIYAKWQHISLKTQKGLLGYGFDAGNKMMWDYQPQTIFYNGDQAPQTSYSHLEKTHHIVKLLEENDILPQTYEAHQKTISLITYKGKITIEHTQAATMIDVDAHLTNDSDQVVKANQEAFIMIMRHINLRQLAGIIMIDFIHMPFDIQKNFLQWSKKHTPSDIKILGFTKSGMMEIIKSRTYSVLPQEEDISTYAHDFFARNILRNLYYINKPCTAYVTATQDTIEILKNTYQQHLITLKNDYQIHVTYQNGYDSIPPVIIYNT